MAEDNGTLARLYETLDTSLGSPEGRAAILNMLAEDFAWEFSLPDKVVGGGFDVFEKFLLARAQAAGHAARHRVIMAARSGRNELLFGNLETDGAAPSPFVAAAEIDGEGRIRRMVLRRTNSLIFGEEAEE